MEECDVCKKKVEYVVDYFCNLCQECSVKHTDIILLRRLGEEINKNF